ncbi:MAG TPA: hypothetical protein VI749_02540 [Candidatus Omnitrophota bacterium]|nr:hypothetical protein [Candidatus Omnitrophota bacterium]
MWWKWLPWRFVVRDIARRQGFLDPIKVLSQLQNFAQPSEVAAPTELLRSGVVLHARGLMNSLAIQHNLDWVWPYWVERQYNPQNAAFIPRSFSLTQINLTHRNWTAVGIPDCREYPIVDPRGLVTPLYDGWSLDAWILVPQGQSLIPSRSSDTTQQLLIKDNLTVVTRTQLGPLSLSLSVQVVGTKESPFCHIQYTGLSQSAAQNAWLVVSLRPYNPEGVSFIHDIELLDKRQGWLVNKETAVYFDKPAGQYEFSYYRHGDVFSRLPSLEDKSKVYCKVGMATAAALFKLSPDAPRQVTVQVPLGQKKEQKHPTTQPPSLITNWNDHLHGQCQLKVPDEHFQFLYEAAIRTLILHSPKEVYPGPYTYRRFWFRDAAFILHAMLCVGFTDKVRRAIDCFPSRQMPSGYFLSQEGEWDSNGEALWIMRRFCEMTGLRPDKRWLKVTDKAGRWISRKRLASNGSLAHAGLLPPGFSAEHLGPNDYYYWDNFWGIEGLRAAGYLEKTYGNPKRARHFNKEAEDFFMSVNQSLAHVKRRLERPAMPAAPYRRMDAGAIGSLAAGYPLQIFAAHDPRLLDTVEYLTQHCFMDGGFFHDMTHSGINPYLTLHIAQVLLRAGDPRYFEMMSVVAKLASPTGQWPEAIHPITKGGCMGDGQHVWAAAEWILMLRNCFVREEGERLILCSGILRVWLEKKQAMSFGPAPTRFGTIQISVKPLGHSILVEWKGSWFSKEPPIDIQLPGFVKVTAGPGALALELSDGDKR